MIAARNDRTTHDVGQSVAIGDKHFEVVKEFVYLGSLMTRTNDVSLDIQRRNQTASRCIFGLHKHLQSSHLSRQTKFTIHKTLIRSVLLYGSETWVLTKREDNQLLVFEKKVLLTICGPKMVSTGGGTTNNSIDLILRLLMDNEGPPKKFLMSGTLSPAPYKGLCNKLYIIIYL
jgi:hypothetical protein